MNRRAAGLTAIVAMLVLAGCVRVRQPDTRPTPRRGATLWKDPGRIATADLINGPWGAEHAPSAKATYRFIERKHKGVNPGMTVVDPDGRAWSVKQTPPGALDHEAQVEVAISRLLSAIGYYQAPVYFLPTFTLNDDRGSHTEVGGRFRLKDKTLKEVGAWSWTSNPFIGTRAYNGLLSAMVMFNSTDLKNENNSIYEHHNGDRVELWYAVRDIGSALGDTRRLGPYKSDPDAFEKEPFIIGVTRNRVRFAYTGYYERYVRDRIAPADVRWTADLLGQLRDSQWQDAFRAGGYDEATATRFIRRLQEKIREGRILGAGARS
jgi:hypothetical protein